MLDEQQLDAYRQALLSRRETLQREHAQHADDADSVELGCDSICGMPGILRGFYLRLLSRSAHRPLGLGGSS